MFLTSSEMTELTGYRRFSKQIGWLKRYEIAYFVAASGRPVVLRSTLDSRTIPAHGPPPHPRPRSAAKAASQGRIVLLRR